MTFVKICGITNLEDAFLCLDAGADALGFNFYRLSSRFITPKAARNIIDRLPSDILTVGVFVNEHSPTVVEELADEAGVRALQLHGDESPEYCLALNQYFVIKALRVQEEFDINRLREYTVSAIMLDAFHTSLRGGTGRVFDWSIAASCRQLAAKLFLAGGLSPENIRQAIAAVEPYGVDACSALEVRPGKKDAQRVFEFIKAARTPFKR